jgi:transcriptional regulator of acetoin/glycerol metabolism
LFSLSKNNHNISRTAKSLGITRATIYKVIHANDGDRHHWRKRHP